MTRPPRIKTDIRFLLFPAGGAGASGLLPLDAVHVDALLRKQLVRRFREVNAVRRVRRRLLDHLVLQGDLRRADERRAVHHADALRNRPDQRVDLVRLPELVAAAERRAVREHDVRALLNVVAAVRPTLERRGEEVRRRLLVRLARDPVTAREDAVLEHSGADVLQLDDVQVVERVELAGLRVLRLEHLRELVVRHRRRSIDLAIQERVHVERLVEDLDALILRRVHAVLRQRGEELELVAAAPDADRLVAHLRDRVDAGVLEADLRHPRTREDLRDVDEVRTGVAGCEEARQPVDPELGLAAGHDLLGRDARPADLDVDVESELLVEALRLGRVVAGELGLRDPFQLERDLRQLLRVRLPRRSLRRTEAGPEAERQAEQRNDGPDPVLPLHARSPFSCVDAHFDAYELWKSGGGCQRVAHRSTRATDR